MTDLSEDAIGQRIDRSTPTLANHFCLCQCLRRHGARATMGTRNQRRESLRSAFNE